MDEAPEKKVVDETRKPDTLFYKVEVLLEADCIGDTAAAAKMNCTRQTVYNYRKQLKTDSELLDAYVDAKKRVFSSIVTRIAKTQDKFLEKMVLALENETSLREITAAYKAVYESFLAQSIMTGLSDPPKELNAKHNHKSAPAEDSKRAIRQAIEGNRPTFTSGGIPGKNILPQ